MGKILLVEDAPEFQLLVKAALCRDHEITIARTAGEARKAIESAEFDLFLLDLGLPDSEGFDFCNELRSNASVGAKPILLLTGRSAVLDRVTGFGAGADDYITKPFEPLELAARVSARLRSFSQSALPPEYSGTLCRGKLKLSMAHQRAYLADSNGEERDVQLTPIEFRLLYSFIRNEGQIVTRQKLLNEVWGEGVHVVDRIIDRHVCSLRQKLAEEAQSLKTVPREGYCFQI